MSQCRRVGDEPTTPTQPRPHKKDSTSSLHNSINRSSAPLTDVLTQYHLSIFLEEDKRRLDLTSRSGCNQPKQRLSDVVAAAWVGFCFCNTCCFCSSECVGPVAVGSGQCPVATKPTSPKLRQLLGSSPPVKIGESAVHQEPKSKCLWAKQRALCPRSSAFGSRVCSSFPGAHRLQVARRRWVLQALSSLFLGARPLTGFNLER